jgi:hypothetical protein
MSRTIHTKLTNIVSFCLEKPKKKLKQNNYLIDTGSAAILSQFHHQQDYVEKCFRFC